MINLKFLIKPLISFTTKHTFNSSVSSTDPLFLYTQARHALAKLLQRTTSEKPSSLQLKESHARIVVLGFQSDVFLANSLLLCYSKKMGLFRDARKVFDTMPERNSISWSSVVSMYTQKGFNSEALAVFSEFRRSSDWAVSEYVLGSVFRACAQFFRFDQGCQIHCFVVKNGFDQDVFVGTSLIDFYAKCGDIEEARSVFDGLVSRNLVTWTSIITGYVKAGKSELALQLFFSMRETNVVPDKHVLSSVLSACSMLGSIEIGRGIHGYVLRVGVEMDLSVLNVLIDLYVKCGKVETGRRIFDHMVVKNAISWTTMIAGYMKNSYNWDALELFSEMASLDWKPDEFTCTSVLTSCASLKILKHGTQIHCYVIKVGLERDSFVRNGLIDMYSKCESLADARRVFDGMCDPSVISYNAMIEGYSRQENLSGAIDLFHRMRFEFLQPSLLTFISLLGVSATLFTLELTKQIHSLIIRFGFASDVFASSALADVYSKSSCIEDARLVFDAMKQRDIVVWNAMLGGYVQCFDYDAALRLYFDLTISGQKPDNFTFASLLTVSSNLASLRHGQKFHNQLIKFGLDYDPFITSSLVDMYSKCGSVEEARKTFNSNISRDVVSWNSMISTYAIHGEAEKALDTFSRMKELRIKPNYVTFVGVLSSCSHTGLVEEGLLHFDLMSCFGIEPGIDHYACIVSLLCRAGKLNEAKDFIEKMPIKPEPLLWRSLLSACRARGNVELGKYAAEMSLSSGSIDSGTYVLLSNVFASKGLWEDVKRVRKKMDFDGVVKEAGQSWIEIKNEVHRFVARDRVHRESAAIFSALDSVTMQIRADEYELECYHFDIIGL